MLFKQDNTPIEGMDCVVFDLGGVVIDLNRDRAVEELVALGVEEADDLLNQYRQRGLFLDLECGRLSCAEFYDDLRDRCISNGHAAPSDRQLQDAFNAFLVDLPVERLAALRKLRQSGKRVIALSNTNPVMYPTRISEFFRQEGLTINDYFEGVVASFMEGWCKPNPQIFSNLLRRYGLDASKTLFLDDSVSNCEAAVAEGINALHIGYDAATDMLAAIERLK